MRGVKYYARTQFHFFGLAADLRGVSTAAIAPSWALLSIIVSDIVPCGEGTDGLFDRLSREYKKRESLFLRTCADSSPPLPCRRQSILLLEHLGFDTCCVHLRDRLQLLLAHLLDLLCIGDLRHKATHIQQAAPPTGRPAQAVHMRTTWYDKPFCSFSFFLRAFSSLAARAACAPARKQPREKGTATAREPVQAQQLPLRRTLFSSIMVSVIAFCAA